MTLGRRCASAIVGALALVVPVAGFTPTANAATAYRYWTYYVSAPDAGAWTYSQRGPGFEHPQDGEVQGWRFAIQADRSGGFTPRFTPDFAKLCGSQPVTAGKVRVAIVLDFGVTADAPAGEHPPANVVTGCVLVADGASGVDVLDAAVGTANVRIGQGLICGIDGYPKSECAIAVTPPAAAAPPTVATTAKATAATAKSTAAPTATTSAPAMPTPTAAAAQPSGPTAASPAASSNPPPSSAASSPLASTLETLRKPKHKVFPTGAVIGVALVFALAIAAAIRGSGSRR